MSRALRYKRYVTSLGRKLTVQTKDKTTLSARIVREGAALHLKPPLIPNFILHADLHCIRRIYEC